MRLPFNPKLYLVTDTSLCMGRSLIDVVLEAVSGGVTLVQLREKNLNSREFCSLASALQKDLKERHVPLIINDRLDIALASGAAGVHLGQTDIGVQAAREILGSEAIIGVSIERLQELEHALTLPVDYLAVSPVFSTSTKKDVSEPLGLTGVKYVCSKSAIPIVGIGGIHAQNADSVFAAGAHGIAVVSAICSAPSPRDAAAALSEIAQRYSNKISTNAFTTPNAFFFPKLLTIAGSDSCGGAGIQADLKTFSALKCIGMSVVTAVTAQNTREVTAIHTVPCDLVNAQIEAVLKDIGADAVKIGMLATDEVISTVVSAIRRHRIRNIVLDPVMVSKSGDKLLHDSAVTALRDHLIPLATVITPNLPEAEVLVGTSIVSRGDMIAAAKKLGAMGAKNVVIKGGHLDDIESPDLFFDTQSGEQRWISKTRILSKNTHGTGCTFSSALAASLGHGMPPLDAAFRAKSYVTKAIAGSKDWIFGKGHGPVHHFHDFWK